MNDVLSYDKAWYPRLIAHKVFPYFFPYSDETT